MATNYFKHCLQHSQRLVNGVVTHVTQLKTGWVTSKQEEKSNKINELDNVSPMSPMSPKKTDKVAIVTLSPFGYTVVCLPKITIYIVSLLIVIAKLCFLRDYFATLFKNSGDTGDKGDKNERPSNNNSLGSAWSVTLPKKGWVTNPYGGYKATAGGRP